METRKTNPEKDQDRVFDLADHFDRFGDVMFKQQRRIYENLRDNISEGFSILEAGCGNGVGSAILAEKHRIVATDKSIRNVTFAQCLYSNIHFGVWDIKGESFHLMDSVVAVEVFEHVSDPENIMENLIQSARTEVWVTSPNGEGGEHPPSNPYHVSEYTVEEMFSFIPDRYQVFIRDWETFSIVPTSTDVSPLVYQIRI